MTGRRIGIVLAAVVLATGWCHPAAAEEPASVAPATWLATVAADAAKAEADPPPAGAWKKPIPLTVGVNYTLVTDYIFRGINFSEYAGEGREKLNHQLGIHVAYEPEKLGKFGVVFWLEWYADQEKLTPRCDDHLQEVDYIVYWSYPIKPIATTVETGWIGYTFPQASGDCFCTNEWYVMLSLDDAKLFGTKANVLNPYVAFYLDLDLFHPGSWLEFGVSHDFVLADFDACKNVPVVKNLTVTPSLVVGLDHRYLNKAVGFGREATQLGNIQSGLAVSYDLSGALGLPPQYGDLILTGFFKFSNAIRDELINDEFWGGVTVAWEW